MDSFVKHVMLLKTYISSKRGKMASIRKLLGSKNKMTSYTQSRFPDCRAERPLQPVPGSSTGGFCGSGRKNVLQRYRLIRCSSWAGITQIQGYFPSLASTGPSLCSQSFPLQHNSSDLYREADTFQSSVVFQAGPALNVFIRILKNIKNLNGERI